MIAPKKVALPDGRQLAYAQYGLENGSPVMYHHGWPSSRLEAALMADAATQAGVCLIALDRPGMGHSDVHPHRTLLDWPADLTAVADALQLDQFPILGVSGGGPYVAACAYKIPERLSGATIVAGLSPLSHPQTKVGMRTMTRLLLTMGKTAPWLLKILLGVMKKSMQYPKILKRMLKDLPEVDKAIIDGLQAELLLEIMILVSL